MKLKVLLSLNVLLIPGMILAWGQKGHDTTAYIAECHLTEATKDSINNILDGKSIVYYANWLDNASHTPEYSYTKTWHYKNIDDGMEYEEAPLLETGDVVRAIYEQATILQDPTKNEAEKQLALKILVHVLGDIHQPMHMGHASDLGGNRWIVNYFGRDSNLHSVWDSSVPESAHKWTYTEWQNQIDRVSKEREEEILIEGNPEKWGKETYEICKKVYQLTPENTKISYDYVSEWTELIEDQFLKGGLRLADILNSIYDPEYKSYNTFIGTQIN